MTDELVTVDDGRLQRTGAIFMSGFAFVWSLAALPQDGVARPVLLVAGLALTATTFGLALRVRGGMRTLVADWQRRYNRVVLAQFAAIAAVVVSLVLVGEPRLVPPVVCVVVGLHFVPMVKLFGQRLYGWTAVALTAAGLQGIVTALTVGAAPARTATGLAAAVTLWVTAAVLALRHRSRQLTAASRHPS